MKKIILIASLVITFVGVFLVALPFLLNISGLARPAKRYLLSYADKNLSYSLKLDNFKIGLGTLSFNQVDLKSNNKRYHLFINQIRLGYRLSSLLLHPKDPLRSLESVTLVGPELVVHGKGSSSESTSLVAVWQTLQNLLTRLNRKNAIKYFRVEKGNLFLRQKNKNALLLIRNLGGILQADGPHGIAIGLHGSFLSDQKDQIALSGKIDLQNQHIRLLCNLPNYDVRQSAIVDFLPAQMVLRKGVVSGWLLMESRHFNPDSLQLNGELHFKNFALNYARRPLDHLQFKAVIANNRLLIDSLKAQVGSAPITLTAWVDDIFNPQFNAQLRFDRLNAGVLFPANGNRWHAQTLLSGLLNVQVLPGPWRGMLKLERGKIRLASGRALQDVRFRLLFSPDTIRVERLFARLGAATRMRGRGLYRSASGDLHISLHAEHLNAHHVIFDEISQKVNALDVRLSANVRTHRIAGQWQFHLSAPGDTLMALSGNILGDRQALQIKLLRSAFDGFNASLRVSDYWHHPNIDSAFVQNLPVDIFTSSEFLTRAFKRVKTAFWVNGPLDRLKLHLNLTDRQNNKNSVEMIATLSNGFSARRVLSGLIRLKNITGNAKIEFSDAYLAGEFRFGDQLLGNLDIDFTRKQYLKGELLFNHFKVVQAFSDSVIANNFHFLGTIQGRILLHGDLQNPLLSMDLSGDRFVFNDVGYYQGLLKLAATKDSVNVDTLAISINNMPIIQGKGNADLKNKILKGAFFGRNVDVEQVLATLAPGNNRFSGQADYDLNVNGSLKQPIWNLFLNVRDGYLDRIKFDHLAMHLKNSYIDGGSFLHSEDQLIKLDKLDITRTDHYHLSGLGQIPLYATGPIDLYLNFEGDLFEFIPLYQPFFEKGISQVSLHLALGGSPDRLRLSSGFMAINNGELWLKNVAPHIQNISGVIEKKSGDNKINFINLTASSGGETLTINTVRQVRLPNGEMLRPWYFKGLDLDFGILKLETTGRGVRLHLPGFMQAKDFGRLALGGMTPKESFYFAGPVEHPRIRGKVKIYDTRLTFPFLKVGHGPVGHPDVVVQFLQNLDWDLWVRAGEDVVYFRNIPAYIDNVNTELFVDESSPGLHLRGILSNKTFRVSGKVSSSRGRLEYLDQTFRVDYFQAEFTESSPFPFISGQAWTTIRDSIGAVPKTVYLKLYAVDPETHQEKQQGSLENFKFKLVSADPQIGEDQERVLSYLGFSIGNLREKATSVGGAVTDKYIFRPLFRPIERAIERNLGIDFVRINSNIAKNLFYTSIGYGGRNFGKNQPLINPFNTSTPYLFLMSSSEVTLGKYLTQNLYLTYTGQLVSVYDQTKPTFDMNHSFGIEYRFLRNILLEIEYDRELMGYYKIPEQKQYLEDIKIRLRHSFTF